MSLLNAIDNANNNATNKANNVVNYAITYALRKLFALSPSNPNKEAVLLAPISTGHASFPGDTCQSITADHHKVHKSRMQTKVIFLKR